MALRILAIIETVLVTFYVFGVIFIDASIFAEFGLSQVFFFLLTTFFLRWFCISESEKGLRFRRELLGYVLMLGGLFFHLFSYALAVVTVLTGATLWASRAFYELFLWVKVIRMGDDWDEEITDRIDAELMGEDFEPTFEFEDSDE